LAAMVVDDTDKSMFYEATDEDCAALQRAINEHDRNDAEKLPLALVMVASPGNTLLRRLSFDGRPPQRVN
jgi:hypothetical protein